MALLLILVVVCLAITVGFTTRIILLAHRRAQRSPVVRGAGSGPVVQDASASPDYPQSPQNLPHTPFAEPSDKPKLACLFIAESDAYADPIDGIPFLPGEAPISCTCGLAYRAESLDWLALHCSNQCVQCGSVVGAVQPSLA